MTDLLAFIETAVSGSDDLEPTLAAVCGSERLREHLLASAKERASLSDTLSAVIGSARGAFLLLDVLHDDGEGCGRRGRF
ncbi:hypothetical protein OHT76_37365 [Streptomyces sp. NBC_00287]|uniref:hypothetical protein n=1 Tax=Streptomyces sp. NBC_00287 TaxID=2975702 RepID=UPI002E2D808F|nr:hypothetical protein [Streptomyces sp. NBC_00287]